MEGGNSAGDVVDIASLTNMTILPLVNSLLNLSLDTVVSQFYEEVAKVVSRIPDNRCAQS